MNPACSLETRRAFNCQVLLCATSDYKAFLRQDTAHSGWSSTRNLQVLSHAARCIDPFIGGDWH